MLNEDLVRIRHMYDAARDALYFIEGKAVQDLYSDRLLAVGLMKCIEIIGEAASKISLEFRSDHAYIAWLDIVGMRNRLAHAYFDVNLHTVWGTVVKDLPPLTAQLEKIMAEVESL